MCFEGYISLVVIKQNQCDGVTSCSCVLKKPFLRLVTFMNLADMFIKIDLQCIQGMGH